MLSKLRSMNLAKDHTYSVLPSEEQKFDGTSNSPAGEQRKGVYNPLSIVFIAIFSSLLGFLLGSSSHLLFQDGISMYEIDGSLKSLPLPPLGPVRQTFVYNRTFSDPPSQLTDQAWSSIFPKGVGFVQHPEVAPEVSGVTVFHQLHCLNSLRIAYYAALENGGNGDHAQARSKHKHEDHNSHGDPHHIRHCIDYIRQGLMCQADASMELVDMKLGGSTGWGTERQCRDYELLKQWSEEWRKAPSQ